MSLSCVPGTVPGTASVNRPPLPSRSSHSGITCRDMCWSAEAARAAVSRPTGKIGVGRGSVSKTVRFRRDQESKQCPGACIREDEREGVHVSLWGVPWGQGNQCAGLPRTLLIWALKVLHPEKTLGPRQTEWLVTTRGTEELKYCPLVHETQLALSARGPQKLF